MSNNNNNYVFFIFTFIFVRKNISKDLVYIVAFELKTL